MNNDALAYAVGETITFKGEECTIFHQPWLEMDGTVSMGVSKPEGTRLKINMDRFGECL